MDIKQEELDIEEENEEKLNTHFVEVNIKQEHCTINEEYLPEEVAPETHIQQDYCCAHCPYQTNSRKCILNHLKIHLSRKQYRCKQCGYQTVFSWTLTKHLKKHTGEKPFQCKQCKFRTRFKTSLRDHELKCKMINEPKYFCVHCDFKTKNKHKLTVHSKEHDNLKSPRVPQKYYCLHCSYHTEKKRNLRSHMMIHSKHRKPSKLLNCTICEKSFKNARSFKFHLQKHAGEKAPYHCKECNYATYSKSYIKQHESIHTGAALYKCKFCTSSFRYRPDLTRHVQKHTGQEKMLHCTQCFYVTGNASSLYCHLKTHSEERPFACTKCSYRAKLKKGLRKHEKALHPELTILNERGPIKTNTEEVSRQLEVVPNECVMFNSYDFIIKEECKDDAN